MPVSFNTNIQIQIIKLFNLTHKKYIGYSLLKLDMKIEIRIQFGTKNSSNKHLRLTVPSIPHNFLTINKYQINSPYHIIC